MRRGARKDAVCNRGVARPSIMGAAELLPSALAQTLGQAGKGAGFAKWEGWGCPDALRGRTWISFLLLHILLLTPGRGCGLLRTWLGCN